MRSIAPAIPEHYPELIESQRAVGRLLSRRHEPRALNHDLEETAGRIQAGEFSVTIPPGTEICRECDPQALCRAEGVIGEAEALAA